MLGRLIPTHVVVTLLIAGLFFSVLADLAVAQCPGTSHTVVDQVAEVRSSTRRLPAALHPRKG